MSLGQLGLLGRGFSKLGTPGGVAPYLGQVATRCFALNTLFANTAGFNSRTAHYARDNITSLQLVFGNWYAVPNSGETSQGGTQTLTASVEYPAGVYTRVKFAGSNSVVLADGANIVSDVTAVVIPKGALFWTKRYQLNAVALAYCALNASSTTNLALGDAVNGSSVDETATASVDAGGGSLIPPLAIIAQTRLPSIGIIGDSRDIGIYDTTVDATGDTGYCRMFGDQFAYTNMAISGESAAFLVSNGAKRLAILDNYVSHRWIGVGGSDLLSAIPAATILGNVNTLIARWPRSKVIVSDHAPLTTSSDNWTTTGNQTATAAETERVALNSSIAALTGINQSVAISTVETQPASSFAWKNDGVTALKYTVDGLHETSAMLLFLKANNPFNAARVN